MWARVSSQVRLGEGALKAPESDRAESGASFSSNRLSRHKWRNNRLHRRSARHSVSTVRAPPAVVAPQDEPALGAEIPA